MNSKLKLIQAHEDLLDKTVLFDDWGKKLFKTTLPAVNSSGWIEKFTLELENKFGVSFGVPNYDVLSNMDQSDYSGFLSNFKGITSPKT